MTRLVIALVIFLFISGSVMGAAPPCRSVIDQLSPCVPFLSKQEKKPDSGCCSGVKYLKKYSTEKGDRQSICECLESVVPMYGGIDYSLISSLPNNCGVSVKLPKISSPNFDCSKA